jgi:lipopolysaccharide/colanic/teichoic acid biosynthesis glycosyltransferase
MTRLANVIIACALLLLTLPLMVFIGLAIQCESPGPIFERNPRFAPSARRYLLLTFRTTRYPPPDALPSWTRKPTRVGAFLRYTRIAALPQLLNALRGDISLLEADGWPSPFRD